jgi:para-nitrobenzyl esterase
MNWKSILRFKAIAVVVALVLMTIPVGYAAAADGGNLGVHIVDPVKTDAGLVSGTTMDAIQLYYFDYQNTLHTGDGLVGEVGELVRVYRGIPYAAPPVGNLRWKPPQPVTPWEGIRVCTEFCPMAAQYPFPQSFFWGRIPESGMSEDVLYLNVVTPAKKTNERLPVLVFFHGGGLTTGSCSYDAYNAPALAQHGVVWVTVQHRIGALGYMAHPALSAESPEGASGNYGQLDLIAALQWVQKNIAAFGGDAGRVTIIGQSGGGAKVNFLMASPLAKGLFHRAVCQSGFSTGATALATAEQRGVNLAAKLGIFDSGPAGLAALRLKTWQEIVTATITLPINYITGFTVDNWSLTDTIANIFDTGKQQDVPYMVSLAGAEVTASTPAMGNRLLTMSLNQKSNIYVYVFTQVPDGWKSQGVYAWHGSDVSSMFGDQTTLGAFLGALLPTTITMDPGVTEKDFWVSEFMMNMLANFAATGNPSVSVKDMGVKRANKNDKWEWPAYKNPQQYYLDIGFQPLVKTDFATLTTKQPPR